LRIVIETDIQPGEPPTGVLRREGLGDGTRFSGWIDILRLLEEAVRQGRERATDDEGLEATDRLCRGDRPRKPHKTRDSPGADFLRRAVR
jgi:hypothetical protein